MYVNTKLWYSKLVLEKRQHENSCYKSIIAVPIQIYFNPIKIISHACLHDRNCVWSWTKNEARKVLNSLTKKSSYYWSLSMNDPILLIFNFIKSVQWPIIF